MKKWNVNQLKYFAAFFMALDSMYLAMPALFPEWFHLISRFVSPLFAFFVVEGFFHTGSRKKYLLRLWTAAALMQAGDYLSFILLGKDSITDNIFLALAIGFSLMCVMECAKNAEKGRKVAIYGAAFLIYLAGAAFSVVPVTVGRYSFGLEGGIQVLSVVAVFYLFYGNRRKQIIAFLIWNALFIALTGIPSPWDYEDPGMWFSDLCFNSENLTFLFLPFLFLYNGEKGRKTAFNRYFFYVFYPAHLWFFHLIAAGLRGR
jgi:hypothetical protein